jgi:hypothetical protein
MSGAQVVGGNETANGPDRSARGLEPHELPRARISAGERDKEWPSGLIARYEHRARSVDQRLLDCYLSGANGRRIQGALSPLLRGTLLSKTAISRLLGRLEGLCRLPPNSKRHSGCELAVLGKILEFRRMLM